MNKPATWLSLLKGGQQTLAQAGCDSARRDAELLLADLLDTDIARLYLDGSTPAGNDLEDAYQDRIARRATFEPAAYITGKQAFWQHDFIVNQHTLVPRPDTETLVEAVLARLDVDASGTLLDLGTGSGCILLSLLDARPGLMGTGVDISPGAAAVARQNAARLGLDDRADICVGNWLDVVIMPEDGFDVIVSNPPYIAADVMAQLMPDVRDFEPSSALEAGGDGLDVYRLFARLLPGALKSGGLLALEIGYDQGASVTALMQCAGFDNVTLLPDIDGRDRVVLAYEPRIA